MKPNTLIIGAGVSGLAAANILTRAHHPVILLDKGRGVGGRAATRKLGDRNSPRGQWDHGAQFATFRSPAVLRTLRSWGAFESSTADQPPVLTPWHNGPDGSPRYHSLDGFNAFAKALAEGLEIHNSLRISSLKRISDDGTARWSATAESGETVSATNLICTLPAPQLIELLQASELDLPGIHDLNAIQYHRNLTLLAELSGPSGLEEPGYMRPQSGLIKLIVDNNLKGISKAHTVTAQATPAFSLEWYDRDRATAASVLRAALQETVESPIVDVQIHGWKFSKAYRRHPQPCLELDTGLWASGDGFKAGDEHAAPDLPARIESAILSGIAVAEAILKK